jgi:NhaP-type Na+/H+ or K+/H+ antiporter
MYSYTILLVVLGIAILGVAWLPSLLSKYPLSYPILFVLFGMLIYALPLGLPIPDPLQHKEFATHLSELCVIVALTSTGLKIDRPFSLRGWVIPLRLVLITMILTIGLFSLLGWFMLGLLPASALLLAAGLAPTDPVLAGDVQVGDPGEGMEDHVRFALTGEAGLNDGLAFPFVYAAIALLPSAIPLQDQLLEWLWKDVLCRLAIGLVSGWLSGKLLSYLIFDLPKKIGIKTSAYGFVALAVTLTTYGVTELIHGYGFLAVFIASITMRSYERSHEYHRNMHDFSDQIERLLIVALLIFFGGSLVGGLLQPLTWTGALAGLALLLIIRPLTGMLTLLKSNVPIMERWVISGFGIRGIGSFFYIAFALGKAEFPEAELLWAITGFTVLTSIFLHGMLATPVMAKLDTQNAYKHANEQLKDNQQGEKVRTES